MLVPAALAFLAATGAALLLPPRYRGVATVRVEWAAEDASVAQRSGADPESRRLSVLRLRLLSRPAMERVLEETKPYPAPGREGGSPLEPADRLLSALTVKPRGADTFAIEYVHTDPGKAALVPNRLASLLVAEADEERARRSAADPRLLEARMVEARKAIEDKAAAVRRFREGGTRAAPADAGPEPGRRERLEAETSAVAIGLSAAKARAEGLQLAIAAEDRAATSQASGPSAELARVRAERAELRKRYTEEHPDVETLNQRIRELEARVPSVAPPTPGVSSLRAQLAAVEVEIETLRQQAARLDGQRASPTRDRPPADIPSGSASKRDLEALTRDYEQAQRAFLAVQEAWSEAETASRLGRGAAARFELREPARVPERPYFPDRILFALAGLALGLTLGLMSAGVAEIRDHRIKSPEDLQEILALPIVAQIPFVRVSRPRRGNRRGGLAGLTKS